MAGRATDHFSYATIEQALARVHGVDDAGRGAFRARLQHFQKLDLTPARPGRGKHLVYSDDWVFAWAFGLELAALGMSPAAIVAFVLANWNAVQWGFATDEEEKGDRFLVLDPNALSDEVRYELAFGSDAKDPDDPHLAQVLAKEEFATRAIVVNVSEVRSRVVDALQAVRAAEFPAATASIRERAKRLSGAG